MDILALVALGFGLGLDNFRSSIVLGGLKPSFAQSAKTSMIFGIWDGIAPLVGILGGMYLVDAVQTISEYGELIAAIALAAYGIWIIVKALRSGSNPDVDLKVARRYLPAPLSIDNLGAGAVLGLAGYSPWVAPILFAVCTFVLSLVGHQVGRTIANFAPKLRTDLITGVVLVIVAVVFYFFGGE